jgi:hypothetical protein
MSGKRHTGALVRFSAYIVSLLSEQALVRCWGLNSYSQVCILSKPGLWHTVLSCILILLLLSSVQGVPDYVNA